jgi:phosphinothricin acetyltransferase
MDIRDAVEADFDRITAIYNDIVLHSTATYNDRPASIEARIAWWRSREQQGCPVLVAADGANILGFASFGDFRSWPGYRFTVETTIYIQSQSRGRGVGTVLLTELVSRAKNLGKHSMIAAVDSENTASLSFLKRFGFEQVGYLPQVGFKFDRFLDLVVLQYGLTPPIPD